MATRFLPHHVHLYSSVDRISVQAASEIARARSLFLTMLRTVRTG